MSADQRLVCEVDLPTGNVVTQMVKCHEGDGVQDDLFAEHLRQRPQLAVECGWGESRITPPNPATRRPGVPRHHTAGARLVSRVRETLGAAGFDDRRC